MPQQVEQLSAVHVRFVTPTLPDGIDLGQAETIYDLTRKASSAEGEAIIEADRNRTVDCGNLLQELKDAGYALVSASAQEKLQTGKRQRPTYVINFHFVPTESAEIDESNLASLQKAEDALIALTVLSFWHCMVYLNPGEEYPWISIACAVREQRYLGDNIDTPKLVRDRDEHGEKVGDLHPLEATNTLVFADMTVSLL